MPSVKFIHTADLHLDTPFKGLSIWNAELSGRLKDATFKSFRRIIDICIEKKVDFLVISGDIFDSENRSLASQLRFLPELKRLSDKGIPTYLVCGNHDPYSSWIQVSHLPEKVYYFDPGKCDYVTYRRNDNEPIADIHGISFGEPKTKNNLARKYALAPAPAPFSIAILHGVVGERGPHEEYAPFSVDDVLDKGFDYWALGHIHKTTIVRREKPVIVYPGNPQGRDFGESGRKGCFLVSIEEDQTPEIEFLPTQLIRFEAVSVDLTGVTRVGELETAVRNAVKSIDGYDENTNMILRIDLQGKTPLHEQLNREGEVEKILELFNEGQLSQGSFEWIDRITVNTRPELDLEILKKGNDFSAEVIRAFDQVLADKDKIEDLFLSVEGEFANAQVKKYTGIIDDEERLLVMERARMLLLDQLIDDK